MDRKKLLKPKQQEEKSKMKKKQSQASKSSKSKLSPKVQTPPRVKEDISPKKTTSPLKPKKVLAKDKVKKNVVPKALKPTPKPKPVSKPKKKEVKEELPSFKKPPLPQPKLEKELKSIIQKEKRENKKMPPLKSLEQARKNLDLELNSEKSFRPPPKLESVLPLKVLEDLSKIKKNVPIPTSTVQRDYNEDLEDEIDIEFSQSSVDPSTLSTDGYELADQSIIPNEELEGTFIPGDNIVEFYIYDVDKTLLYSDYKFEDWNITKNTSTKTLTSTDTLQLYPAKNLLDRGYDLGTLYAVYNFIDLELNSTNLVPYYVSEISSDRTEIRIKSNFISNEEIEPTFELLKAKVNSSEFFDEFYLCFGDNEYHIGVNLELDKTSTQYSIIIKLYDALPNEYNIKDELYVTTKVAETQAFKVEFSTLGLGELDDVSYLQGPNTNLDLNDFINNSTELKSQDDIKNTNSSESKFNLSSILNQKGVKITPNYSYDTYDEFVKFSSAKKRVENFYYKVQQIESYKTDLATLDSLTAYNTVTSDKNTINNNIENIIKNFDGYEYYLYYNDSTFAYPKTGSQYPYPLLNSTSSEVLNWLGSDDESSPYYGGILLSASLYDNKNQDWLLYTIPEFIRNNNDNDNYVDFANMTGQHFDELWLYTKAVAEKNNTTNALDEGIPLKLAEEGIKSLGLKGFGNNFNNQDGYIGLTGEDNGTYLPPTGSETITNYIAINEGNIENYFVDDYVEDGYSETLGGLGFPYAIDRVSKEIYKRLYHNMAYLVKKKGTISGLRQLINIWGIPSTILRINEFGGKDKDHSDDYDLWFKRYNYAYKPVSNRNVASSSVLFPWKPLERNRIADGELIVPDNFQFRFKTTGYPSSQYAGEFFSQSLAVKKSDGDSTSTDFDFGIGLFYEEPTTGSYLGADSSEYADWGKMRFYISGAAADGGTAVSDDIYLPFFNRGWWSVMLQRNQHVSASDNSNATTYTLYAKNKIYNGADGDMIGFEGSASIISNISTSINEAWNKFGTGSADGIYLGGFVSGSNVGGITLNEQGKIFSGSLQEFRYYSNDIPEATFNDFVMNPRSIEGNSITGDESSFDIVNFRAPLGGELEAIFTSSISTAHTDTFTSVHPAVSGKSEGVITGSFYTPSIVSNFTATVVSQGISSTNPTLTLNNLLNGVESFSGIFSKDGGFILCSSTENITADLTFQVNEKQSSPGVTPNNDYRINIIRDRGGVLTTVFTQDYLSSNQINVSTPLSLEPGDKIQVQLVWLGGTSANIRISSTNPLTLDHTSVGVPSSDYSVIYYDNNTAKNFSESNVETFFLDQPAVGIRNRISNKIQVRNSQSYGNILSSQRSIEQEYPINEDFTENINSLEVAFSPQDDINDDIIDSFGYGVIADALADPRNVSQSLDYYPELRETAEDYFKKYTKGNIYDYIRLIKYIDNSLFKAIKNYVPARTSVTTGIVIKQHMLERNRYRQPVIDQDTIVAYNASSPEAWGFAELQNTSYFIGTNFSARSLINNINDSQIFKGALSRDGSEVVYTSTQEANLNFHLSTNLSIRDWRIQIIRNRGGNLTTVFTQDYPSTSYINQIVNIPVEPNDRLRFEIVKLSGGTAAVTNTSLALISDISYNTPLYLKDLEITGGLEIDPIDGGTGGSVEKFNYSGSPEFGQTLVTQSYNNTFDTIAGEQTIVEDTQKEFYDGEYSGSEVVATDQDLFINPFKYQYEYYGNCILKDSSYSNFGTYQNILSRFTTSQEINGIFEREGNFLVIKSKQPVDLVFNFKSAGAGVNGMDVDIKVDSSLRGTILEETFIKDNAGHTGIYFQTSPFKVNPNEKLIIYFKDNGSAGYSNLTAEVKLLSRWGQSKNINANPPFGFFEASWPDNRYLSWNSTSNRAILNNIVYNTLEGGSSNTLRGNIIALGDFHLYRSGITDYSQNVLRLNPFFQDQGGAFVTFKLDVYKITDSPTSGTATSIYGETYKIRFNSTKRGNFFTYEFTPSEYPLSITLPEIFLDNGEDISLSLYQDTGNNRRAYGVKLSIKNFKYYSPSFDNSDYNALLNNFNNNRENTWLFDIDYNQTASSPDNLDLIKAGTANKAQTPDSNYTARRVIYPRYEGSRVSSANYNLYTSASSPIFLNGDTGSWDGDKSYGNTAVVDKYPIYMAHFKSSYNNYTLWDTVEYEIDQLIELPFENVLGIKDFEPKTLKVDGDNKYLKDVNSALEIGRKTGVAYESLTYNRIDYSTIKSEPFLIKESGIEYTSLLSNQISNTTESANISFERFNAVAEFAMTSSTFPLLTTSSNALILEGPPTTGSIDGFISSSFFTFDKNGSYFSLSGSLLAVIHTYNQCLSNEIVASANSLLTRVNIGVEEGADNTDPNNYINFFPTSTLSSYKNEKEPFLIQVGDEIRVQYTLTTGTGDTFNSQDLIQDFIVTNVPKSTSQVVLPNPPTLHARFDGVTYDNQVREFRNLYNKIEVTPNPTTLDIPNGEIYRVTFRRRKQQDSKVLLSQTSPSGSNGIENKSGGGFLIPTDLSETQKRNALTIINQLKGKNSFRNDDPTPPTL